MLLLLGLLSSSIPCSFHVIESELPTNPWRQIKMKFLYITNHKRLRFIDAEKFDNIFGGWREYTTLLCPIKYDSIDISVFKVLSFAFFLICRIVRLLTHWAQLPHQLWMACWTNAIFSKFQWKKNEETYTPSKQI